MAAPSTAPPPYSELMEEKHETAPLNASNNAHRTTYTAQPSYNPYGPVPAAAAYYPPPGSHPQPPVNAYGPPPAGAYAPPPAGAYAPPPAGAYGPPPAGAYGPVPGGYVPPAAPNYYQQHGQPSQNMDTEGNVFIASSFSEKAVRLAFIRKVYLILMMQLLITCGLVAVFVLVDSVKNWVRRNLWFYILAYVTFLITYIALACCPAVRRKYPGNYIALAVFTLTFSYVCAAIASFHDAQAVLIAAGITALVTFSISMFAIQTKIDFTMCSGLIFAAAMTLLFAGLAFMIVRLCVHDPENRYILQCVYGAIAALVLSLFLVFDTQMIVGGKKRKYQLSPEEHIIGAMELYLDIVYIFLIVLACFGGRSD